MKWPSITDVACTCHSLEEQADDPDIPIEFDSRLNEYHLVYQRATGKGIFIIRHCSFCGGKAPKSKRSRLFAKVPGAETHRLAEMTRSLRSLDEVLAALGTPDEDFPTGEIIESPEKDGQPGEIRTYRVLRYKGLSDTAIVHVRVYPTEQVAFWFSGKYIGKDETAKQHKIDNR